jgi:hypothetical protein
MYNHADSTNFKDENPFPGTTYYKLSQTDFDGTTISYDWISISNKEIYLNIMSNTQENICNLSVNCPDETILSYTIYDSYYRIVETKVIPIIEGFSVIPFNDNRQLTRGMYFINANISGRVITKRFIIN